MAERKTFGKLYVVELRHSPTQPDDGEVHPPTLTLYFRGHPTYDEVLGALNQLWLEALRPSKKQSLRAVSGLLESNAVVGKKIPVSSRLTGTGSGTLTCVVSQTKVFWTAPPNKK